MSVTRIDEVEVDKTTFYLSGFNDGDVLMSKNGQVVGKTEEDILKPVSKKIIAIEYDIDSETTTIKGNIELTNIEETTEGNEILVLDENNNIKKSTITHIDVGDLMDKLYRDDDNNEHLKLIADFEKKSSIELYEGTEAQKAGFIIEYDGLAPNTFKIKSHTLGVDVSRIEIPRTSGSKIKLLNSGLDISKLLTLNESNEITSSTFSDSSLNQSLEDLQTNIDTEATNRAEADTALGTRIETEATTRGEADTALGTRIDTEATTRGEADTALGTRIDTLSEPLFFQKGKVTKYQISFTGRNNREINIPYNNQNTHADIYLKILMISRSDNSGSELNQKIEGLLRVSFLETLTYTFEEYEKSGYFNSSHVYIEITEPEIKLTVRPQNTHSPNTTMFLELYTNRTINFSTYSLTDLGSNSTLQYNTPSPDNKKQIYGSLYINETNVESSIQTNTDKIGITQTQIDAIQNLEAIPNNTTITGNLIIDNNLTVDNNLFLPNLTTLKYLYLDSNNKITTSDIHDSNISEIELIIEDLIFKTQDLTRSGSTESLYQLECKAHFSIYQSDPTIPVKLDFKRGASNWGSDIYNDYRFVNTGDFSLQHGNQGTTSDILTVTGSNKKIKYPQLSQNNLLFLDSDKYLTSSSLSHSDLLNKLDHTQYFETRIFSYNPSAKSSVFQYLFTMENTDSPVQVEFKKKYQAGVDYDTSILYKFTSNENFGSNPVYCVEILNSNHDNSLNYPVIKSFRTVYTTNGNFRVYFKDTSTVNRTYNYEIKILNTYSGQNYFESNVLDITESGSLPVVFYSYQDEIKLNTDKVGITQVQTDALQDLIHTSNYLQLKNNFSMWDSSGGDVYLDLKRGSSEWGYDQWDWRIKNSGGNLYFNLGNTNNGEESQILYIQSSEKKLRLPFLNANTVLYLDSNKGISSSTLTHEGLLSITSKFSLDGLNDLIYSGTNFLHTGSNAQLTIEATSGDPALRLKLSNGTLYRIDTDSQSLIFQYFNGTAYTTLFKASTTYGFISELDTRITKDFQCDGIATFTSLSTNSFTFGGQSINVSANNTLLNNLYYKDTTSFTRPTQVLKCSYGTAGFDAMIILQEIENYGFNLKYDGDANKFEINRNDGGTISNVLSIGRSTGDITTTNCDLNNNGDIIGTNCDIIIDGDLVSSRLEVRAIIPGNYTVINNNSIEMRNESNQQLFLINSDGRLYTSTVYYKYPSGTTNYYYRQLNTGNGFLYEITHNGSVNTTNAVWGNYSSGYAINFYRNVNVNGTVVHTSDQRIKQDIEDNSKPCLDIINAIQLKEYNYKYRENTGIKQIGVIAQQIKQDIDDKYNTGIVSNHDKQTSLDSTNNEINNLLSIKKEKMYMFLIGAVQELTKKNSDLEAEIIKLKTQNAEILSTTDYSLNERLTIIEKRLAEVDISKYF